METENSRMIWTVGRKLLIAFSIMIFLGILIGVIGLLSLNIVRASVQEAIATDTPLDHGSVFLGGVEYQWKLMVYILDQIHPPIPDEIHPPVPD